MRGFHPRCLHKLMANPSGINCVVCGDPDTKCPWAHTDHPEPLSGPSEARAVDPLSQPHPAPASATAPHPVRPPACDGCYHLHLLPGADGDGKYCYHPRIVTRSVVGNHEIPCCANAVWRTDCRGEWKELSQEEKDRRSERVLGDEDIIGEYTRGKLKS